MSRPLGHDDHERRTGAPRTEKKIEKMPYRIRKKSLSVPAREMIAVCVDVQTNRYIRIVSAFNEDELRSCIECNYAALRDIPLRPTSIPVRFGGPGVRRSQLVDQMVKCASVHSSAHMCVQTKCENGHC